MTINDLYLLSYLSDIAGKSPGSAQGPIALQHSPYFSLLEQQGIKLHWDLFMPTDQASYSALEKVSTICKQLSDSTFRLIKAKKFFTILGGDHSSAIGVWSGAAYALQQQGALGLIWVDAHMDSHTPETSETGNIHGMPLACLLGKGVPELIQIANDSVKLNSANVCLIGVRSFEQGEAELLKKLNVRIFFIDEVKQRGLYAVMQEAIQHVSLNTAAFGISIDIDNIDPQDAPGTGSREPNGLSGKELCHALGLLAGHPKLIGIEIAEFDPSRDKDQLTEKLIADLMLSLLGKKITI